MALRFQGSYPDDWDEIAREVKEGAGWRCVRCGHRAENPGERFLCDEKCDLSKHPGGRNDGRQRVLTVHHLTGDKSMKMWWALLPLCQVCHLVIQAKVNPGQSYFLEHAEWFKPYAAGFYAWKYKGLLLGRQQVIEQLDSLLALEHLV